MGRTQSELESVLSAAEFAEFYEFSKLAPFGFAQQEYHTALLCQTVANFAGKPEKPLRLQQFMRE